MVAELGSLQRAGLIPNKVLIQGADLGLNFEVWKPGIRGLQNGVTGGGLKSSGDVSGGICSVFWRCERIAG